MKQLVWLQLCAARLEQVWLCGARLERGVAVRCQAGMKAALPRKEGAGTQKRWPQPQPAAAPAYPLNRSLALACRRLQPGREDDPRVRVCPALLRQRRVHQAQRASCVRAAPEVLCLNTLCFLAFACSSPLEHSSCERVLPS